MRFLLIPAAVALALAAAPAHAADIMSCSYDVPMPPPGGPGAMMHGDMGASDHAGMPDQDTSDVPPPPTPPPAPTVTTSLACSHGTEKMQGNLAQLVSQGWNLQSTASIPGSVTFFLTK